ncbi:MAG: site-specific DNA-methyltransferase [Erysipelotrichaceae bacterium]
MYRLNLGDSLEYIKGLDDNSLDHIITDPPYNISKDNNFKTMGRAGIDFGEWDKGFDLTTWINLVSNKIKKGGNIVIFNDWKNLSYICEALENNGFEVKDMIRWEKSNPMPRNRDRRFIVDYETAIWAVKKGAKWTFNRLNDTYDRPLIECGLTPKSEKEQGNHPTQKPVYVMEWLVKHLSNEGDIIFDPFMGSGSTGVACIKNNRKFIGSELDEAYFNISEERIKKVGND